MQDTINDVSVALHKWTDDNREPIFHLDVEIAGAGAFVHSPAVICFLIVIIGAMLRILMVHTKVALTSSRVFLARFNLFKELNIGVSFLLCKLILVFTLVLTI